MCKKLNKQKKLCNKYMDNKAYFMIVHDRLKTNSTLKSGDFLPSHQESENYKKKLEEEKQRQDEFVEKQKNKIPTQPK